MYVKKPEQAKNTTKMTLYILSEVHKLSTRTSSKKHNVNLFTVAKSALLRQNLSFLQNNPWRTPICSCLQFSFQCSP